MKYFFLTEGWQIGRVWEFGGLWDTVSWRRSPRIARTNIAMEHKGEKLWLYQVEDPILMLEVSPSQSANAPSTIGQVMIKRLMNPEEAIAQLGQAKHLVTASTESL